MSKSQTTDMEVPSDAELVAMQQCGKLPSDTDLASQPAQTVPREEIKTLFEKIKQRIKDRSRILEEILKDAN